MFRAPACLLSVRYQLRLGRDGRERLVGVAPFPLGGTAPLRRVPKGTRLRRAEKYPLPC